MAYIKILLVLAVVLFSPLYVLGQEEGSAPSDGSSQPNSDPTPTPTPTPIPTPDSGAETGVAVPSETTAVSRTQPPSPVPAAASPMPTPTPRPSPPQTPTVSVGATPSVSSIPDILPAVLDDSSGLGIGTIIAAIAGSMAFLFFGASVLSKKNKKPDQKKEGKCDSIKELLERKKKELEEMVRSWPEEKLKGIVKDKVVGEIKKDEDAKRIIDAAESLKAKHDELKKAVELLQKKYDLCMLDLPSAKGKYNGVVVENSLKDKKLLSDFKIKKSYQDKDWNIHDVLVDQEKIEGLGEYLAEGPWHIHLWQDGKDDVIVVFKDKVFKIKHSDRATWTEAVEYGKSKGIPEAQLDFKIN